MNKKLISLLSVVIVLCMVIAMTGCTTPTPEATPSAPAGDATPAPEATEGGETPDETKFVSFTQYWDMASHNVNKDTEIFQEVLKRTNVDVTFEVPQSDDGQKLTIMLSSGELPEIMTIDRTNSAMPKLIDAKKVYCITDLMEQYYPSMLKDIEPEYFTYHKYTDGKNYYWTNYIYTPWVRSQPDYPKVDAVFQVTSVRTDIWEAIGKPDVSTPEAYITMLGMVKEKYPDLPTLYMPGWPTNHAQLFMNSDSPGMYYMGEFGIHKYTVEADDSIKSIIRSPKFEDMCVFMNELYTKGYYDPTSITDVTDMRAQKMDNGEVAVMHSTIGNHGFTEGVEYTPIPFFKDMDSMFLKSGAGWLATMVTTGTTGDTLEGVMRYLGYQTTLEGRRLVSWGIEDRHWEWKDESKTEPVKTDLWDNMADPSDSTKKWGFWQTRALHDQYYCNSLFEKWTDERLAWYEIYGDAMKIDIFDGVRNPPLDDSKEGVILANLREIEFVDMPKIIMAKDAATCKSLIAELITKCDAAGLPDLEAFWTAKYKLFDPES